MSQQVKVEEESNTQPKADLNGLEEIQETNMIPATAPPYILDLEKEENGIKEDKNMQKLSIKQEIDQAKGSSNIDFEMLDDSQNMNNDPIVLDEPKMGLNHEEIKDNIREVEPMDLHADPYDLPQSD